MTVVIVFERLTTIGELLFSAPTAVFICHTYYYYLPPCQSA